MGHERNGQLPRTKRWQNLIGDIATFHGAESVAKTVVTQTLQNVRSQYRRLHEDPSIEGALEFLIHLALASRARNPSAELRKKGIELPRESTTLGVISSLSSYLAGRRQSLEYNELARLAASDAIISWEKKTSKETPALFPEDRDVFSGWREAATGSGFCSLARIYFSKLTERYVNYFLDRCASSAISDFQQRDAFRTAIRNHVDKVSHEAFETARVTQSFSAGWFTKHAVQDLPSKRAIRGYLAHAFGKLRDALNEEVGS